MPLAPKTPLSETDYLNGELDAEFKHEFVAGEAFAMAGASEKHNIISLNIASDMKFQLKSEKGTTFIADMKVGIQGDFYYPDVMIVCDEDQNDTEYVKYAPKLIVEVLSKSTRAFDHSIKLEKYLKIAPLEYYVIVEQDYCEISVFSRAAGFIPKFYHLGDEIHFPIISISVTVNDIYDRIENEDKQRYLKSLL
jgi:Uma2 family endonuclease